MSHATAASPRRSVSSAAGFSTEANVTTMSPSNSNDNIELQQPAIRTISV
jgi:hypothetical protein